MFVSGCAWAFLSQQGWRLLAGITVIPISVITLISFWYLPESPRWLMSQGRTEDALEEVEKSYVMNGYSVYSVVGTNIRLIGEEEYANSQKNSELDPFHPNNVQINPLLSDTENSVPSSASPITPSTTHHDNYTFPQNDDHHTNTMHNEQHHAATEEVSYWKLIADPALRRITIPLWAVWMLFGFTYYGIILFVSRVYSTSDEDDGTKCSFDYSAIFINSLSELLGTTLAILLIERIGRVKLQVIFYFLAGLFVALVGVKMSPSGTIAVGFLGRLAVMTASNATWVLTPELYSTEYRTFGHAVCVVNSKIGAFISPYIVISSASIPAVATILGIANGIAALFAYTLPETAGVELGIGRKPSTASQRRSQSFGSNFGNLKILQKPMLEES
jgi:hypothetical protein